MAVETEILRPTIRAHPDRDGLQIVDPIQETQFELHTQGPVDPAPCDPDLFYFPVDTAAEVPTDAIEVPVSGSVWIRDENGAVVAEIHDTGTTSVPEGTYTVEISVMRIKVQLHVEGPLTVESLDSGLRFDLGVDATLRVGARSMHEQPAATVTTTDDPADVMAAVSTLGSALKTTTSERSFPTLRGHPPLVERGSELSIPDHVEAPETGLVIEVPRSLEYVYPVAPLAYYLGAEVRPGPSPRLVTADRSFPLTVTGEFDATVGRVLRQVFLLDCVTRTEGYYDVELRQRRLVEDAVDLDFAALYGTPIDERVEQYLSVPYEEITDAVPTWKLTADVRPDPSHVSALPFLAYELAAVRCPAPAGRVSRRVDESSELVNSFFRDGDALVRGSETGREGSSTSTIDEPVVRPPEADSIEQAYVGEGIPVGASKMTTEAYYRRLEFEPSDEPRIEVTVVCNDKEMTDENVVSEIYGAQDWIDFDITVRERLTAAQLRDVLRADTDFLHYIGHVDDEGIRCADGYLDASDLGEVNVSAFFLNACTSYEQGHALVESGAMAGIATKTDIINEAATSVGRTVAKLLNQGFSLGATVCLIEEYEQIGHHYLVVGDGSAYIVSNESGTPHVVSADSHADDETRVSMFGYPNLGCPLGTIFSPQLAGITEFSLNAGKMWDDLLTDEEFAQLLRKQELPVELDDALKWSSDISEF